MKKAFYVDCNECHGSGKLREAIIPPIPLYAYLIPPSDNINPPIKGVTTRLIDCKICNGTGRIIKVIDKFFIEL